MRRVNLVKSGRFGIGAGAITSVATTLFMTIWEWLENPGGIFRGPDGTNWRFLMETAISWLIPTFVYVSVVAIVGHLVVSGIRHVVARRRGGGD